MSNHVLTTALSIGLALAPLGAWGQSSPPGPAPTKVGVINIQAVIANTGEGKKALADLDKKYEPRRKDLQQQQQEITAIQDQLQKQGTTLSDDEQRRLTRELQEKQTRLKRAQDDAQSDYSADTQDLVTRIGQKLVRIMNEYAQQNGYAVIIEGNPQLIYYAAPQTDLTEQMIRLYDSANPVASTAGAGSSGPARSTAARPSAPKPADKPK